MSIKINVVVQVPTTETEWLAIADTFNNVTNFPHVIGAIDGKHVVLEKPLKSGSTYYNYKHTYSIVLMALVDAKTNFLYVDVGAQGRVGDAGVFNNCKLSHKLQNNELGIPPASILPDSDILCPYMIIGDDAFSMRTYLMKPYHRRGPVKQERIFNYRLSRALRVVENAFGRLANRFRVYRAPMHLSPDAAKAVVLATTVLHNFLASRNATELDAEDDDDYDMEDVSGLRALVAPSVQGRQIDEAKELCDMLAMYFMGPGSVAWQEKMIGIA